MKGKIVAVAIAALLPAACEDDKKNTGGMMSAREKIKIGAMHTLTGEYSDYGIPAQNAIKLAVKEINAAGGVLGKDLEVEFADSATSTDAVGPALTALLGKGIVALVEDNSSGISLKMLEQTGPMNIPQVSASSTSPELAKPNDNFFRTAPSDALQAKVLAKKAREAGLARVAVLHQADDSYGVGLNEEFRRAFGAAGVAASVTFAEMQTSYRDQIRDVLAASPDGVLLVATTGQAVDILQEARAQNANVRWLFPDSLHIQTFIDNLNVAKPLVENCIGTAPTPPQDPTDVARNDRFKMAYMAEYGRMPEAYNDAGYDSVYLLAAAMQRAQSTTGSAVIPFIRDVSGGQMTAGAVEFGPGEWAAGLMALSGGMSVNYQGAAGKVDLDANGDPSGFYVVWTVTNGMISDGAVETPEP